jgi:hypothetical protein
MFDSNQIEQVSSSGALFLNFSSPARTVINSGGGFVGVGTINPSYTVDINGLVGVGTKTAASAAGGNIRYRDDTGKYRYAVGILGTAGETAWSVYDAIAGSYRFSIDSNGSVGIGATPNSSYRLNINPGTLTYGIVVGSAVAGGVGVRADVSAGSSAIAGSFSASNTGSSAVLGSNTGSGAYCYLGTGSYSLYCSGATSGVSDGRLKKDVVTLDSKEGLAAVMQLRPVTYRWKDERKNHQGDPHYREMGFIAQEVEKVLPELVGEVTQPSATADPLVKGKIKSLEYDRLAARW